MTNDPKERTNSMRWSARLPPMSPARAFATVFLFVFLLIFLGSALLTHFMPKSYLARARVFAPGPEQLRHFQSAKLLDEVSQKLNLPATFAASYGETEPLDRKRVEALLRRAVQVRRVSGSDQVEILVYGRSPAECAQLANAIAETGRDSAPAGTVTITGQAVPPIKPARPNKVLNLVLGAAVGIFLGIMAGGVGAKLAVGFDGRDPAKP